MATPWQNYQQQAASPLPPGWEARYDPNQSRYYFINHSTHETTWRDPRLQQYAAQPQQWQPQQQPQPAVVRQPTQPKSPEHIQMKTINTPSQASTSQHHTETRFSEMNETDEDEEWKNSLLKNAMKEEKHLSLYQKVTIKEKLIEEFKDVGDFEVDKALEECKYDENMAKAVLQSLRETKVEKERQEKEQLEKLKKEKKEKLRRKREAELKEKERLERLKEEEEEAEKERERREQERPQSAPSTTLTSAAKNKAKQVKSPKPKTKPVKQKTKRAAEKEKVKSTPVTDKEASKKTKVSTYVSAYKTSAVGSNPLLRRGHDETLITRRPVLASGPNRELVMGPQSINCKGNSTLSPKPTIHKGPQSCLRKGPSSSLQARLVSAI